MGNKRFSIGNNNNPLLNIGKTTPQTINEDLVKTNKLPSEQIEDLGNEIKIEAEEEIQEKERAKSDADKKTRAKGLLEGYIRQTLTIKESNLEIIEALSNYTHKTRREILDILLSASLNSIDKETLEKAISQYRELLSLWKEREKINILK